MGKEGRMGKEGQKGRRLYLHPVAPVHCPAEVQSAPLLLPGAVHHLPGQGAVVGGQWSGGGVKQGCINVYIRYILMPN